MLSEFVNKKFILFSADSHCALGERCKTTREVKGEPLSVCIKICFYDAHCLGNFTRFMVIQ